ncbi:hypothetical protein ACFQ4Z_02675 [Oceanobacillus oncorhynchi subsp. oncorhynchi]|uniref:hypothetical protein n=1 Tax=Oceanobacillus oncorhynchi TaxID=545501 RepID=UPI003645F5C9
MGWIILLWIIALVVIGACGFGSYHFFNTYPKENKKMQILGFSLAGLGALSLVAAILITIPLTNTESFKRTVKSFQSEFQGGITREIVVYSEGGEEIYREQGQFDVEHSEERLKWVDEDGYVQIIYLGRSSTAVVNEIGEE